MTAEWVADSSVDIDEARLCWQGSSDDAHTFATRTFSPAIPLESGDKITVEWTVKVEGWTNDSMDSGDDFIAKKGAEHFRDLLCGSITTAVDKIVIYWMRESSGDVQYKKACMGRDSLSTGDGSQPWYSVSLTFTSGTSGLMIGGALLVWSGWDGLNGWTSDYSDFFADNDFRGKDMDGSIPVEEGDKVTATKEKEA